LRQRYVRGKKNAKEEDPLGNKWKLTRSPIAVLQRSPWDWIGGHFGGSLLIGVAIEFANDAPIFLDSERSQETVFVGKIDPLRAFLFIAAVGI
jgi:hypothetical protein